jgi:outer membrane protein TolC
VQAVASTALETTSDAFRLASVNLAPPQSPAEELPAGTAASSKTQNTTADNTEKQDETDESRDLNNKDETKNEEQNNEKDTENNSDDEPELLPPPRLAGVGPVDRENAVGLPLQLVVASVQSHFPLLQVAFLERNRTSGDQLAAWGEFDTKLKARSENQPLGFYENYQQYAGVDQPLYRGGEVYGGYRIGRGVFEPWYQERQTNEGGEFKLGFQVPFLRDKNIDQRRADLWRATYDRQLAEPEIRAEVIETIRQASIAYWVWVAAGRQVEVGEAALKLAERRNQQISRRVEEGDLDEPSLDDNERAILERQGKLVDLQRKRIQTAVKLSLFLRDEAGVPRIPAEQELPEFPEIVAYELAQLDTDIRYAVSMRPELVALNTQLQRVQVDYAEAYNATLPVLDGFSNVSQDVGEPTSEKRDKSELELELGLEFEMPVQRRKGLGKMRSARAKLGQITAKRQFTVEKISTEVQMAVAALDAAFERVQKIEEAVEISEKLAQVERRKFELGESDLLSVFLREQFAIEAASDLVLAKLDYFAARADYTAALAYEFPVMF